MYLRFTLSYRDVEDLLAERGIEVSYETIRRWVTTFGPLIARRLRARRPVPHRRWHLDEMFVRIGGKQMYLWRAVDAEGEVLEVLVQARRDAAAARKLMRKLLQKQGIAPTDWVTDKCPAYGAALRDLRLDGIPHLRGKRQNNRAESSHVPVRRRERKLTRLQVGRLGAAVPVDARRDLQHLQRLPSPHHRPHAPALSSRGVRGMAGCGWRRGLSLADAALIAATLDNVTSPRGILRLRDLQHGDP